MADATNPNASEVKLIMVDPEKDFETIRGNFSETFAKNEPLTLAANATPEDVKIIHQYIVGLALKEPLSVIAFLGDKNVGGVLNYIITDIPKSTEDPTLTFKNDFTQEIASLEHIEIRARPIVVVNQEIEKNYGFFIPECKKLFKLDTLFVDPNFAGKRIGTKLTQKAIELAQKENCDYVMTVASAAASAKIFKKVGFKCVREIPISSLHANGERMLKDFHDGNKTIKLFFLKL